LRVADSALSPSIHLGRVTSFDPRRGWGTVTAAGAAAATPFDSAATEFDFHATAIADGTRDIALGAEVSFLVVPGHRGRYEAGSITAR
jgi:cold shock CspA family protein